MFPRVLGYKNYYVNILFFFQIILTRKERFTDLYECDNTMPPLGSGAQGLVSLCTVKKFGEAVVCKVVKANNRSWPPSVTRFHGDMHMVMDKLCRRNSRRPHCLLLPAASITRHVALDASETRCTSSVAHPEQRHRPPRYQR